VGNQNRKGHLFVILVLRFVITLQTLDELGCTVLDIGERAIHRADGFLGLECPVVFVLQALHVNAIFLHTLGERPVLADQVALAFLGDHKSCRGFGLITGHWNGSAIFVEVLNSVSLSFKPVIDGSTGIGDAPEVASDLDRAEVHTNDRLVDHNVRVGLLLEELNLAAFSSDDH